MHVLPLRHFPAALAAVAALLAAACAADEPGPAVFGEAQSAVEAASMSEAETLAPLELRIAQDKLAAARQAWADGDENRAMMLAREARVTARLAQARANAQQAEMATRDVRSAVQDLRRELGSGSR